jgi:Asp-tRNAAsn/Glu-tRNAGln amidotransferase A subunit and related amidases
LDLHDFSLRQLRDGLQKRDFSAQELTQTLLKRIHALNPELNAFVTVTEAAALESAARADDRLAKGESGTLLGLPMAHKDIFCTADLPTTCGSKMLKNFIAPYSATVVERLAAEGMVMLGKLNMDEFAMGSSNETSYFGPVRNPWNTEMVPGGSSGGSAAAVAAGLVPVATGTDTGGSIRQPAALCGITGIKPTYGRVSRYGMIAFASSLDQAGPMARSAEDCALLLNAMAAHDPRDSTSHPAAASDFLRGLDRPLQGLRVGVPEEFFGEGLDPEVAAAVQVGIDQLAKQGASIQSIRLPNNPMRSVPITSWHRLRLPATCRVLTGCAIPIAAAQLKTWMTCISRAVMKVSVPKCGAVFWSALMSFLRAITMPTISRPSRCVV